MSVSRIVTFCIALTTLVACASPAAAPAAQGPSATAPAPTCPVLNAGPDVAPGTVLYRDPLVDPCGNWERVKPGAPGRQGLETLQEYEQGGYRVFLGGAAPNDVWTGSDSMFGYRSLADVRVEVEARRVGGPDKNFFGVICRVSFQGSRLLGGYAFYIGSDGRYAIDRKNQERADTIAAGLDQSAIDGAGANRIRADCVGPKLALYANGKKLAEVEDSTYPRGMPGIVVRSIDTAGVDVVFKNFVMTRP